MGKLSDTVGRKKIMLTGMALAVTTWYPIYGLMAMFAPATPGEGFTRQLIFGTYQGYNPWVLAFCVFLQVAYVTMVYGPIAAFLVELFPTKIRYTSMSLPYHIGNGVFGGLVPIIGLSLLEKTGNNFSGLWYPMAIAAICFVVGLVLVKETNHIDIHANQSLAVAAEEWAELEFPTPEPEGA